MRDGGAGGSRGGGGGGMGQAGQEEPKKNGAKEADKNLRIAGRRITVGGG